MVSWRVGGGMCGYWWRGRGVRDMMGKKRIIREIRMEKRGGCIKNGKLISCWWCY